MKKERYSSLEDFLTSTSLSIDDQLDDGWGALFPVKGRELDATILFSDIAGFSKRTMKLASSETLIFVNNFFAWITAEALRDGFGIVDKYIGDEIMIVFSREFGSQDPFAEAIQAARFMSEHDVLSFQPHIGIASGPVTVGYVGTQMKYNCSVFGAPVTMAARCASVRPDITVAGVYSSCIVFPANEWKERELETLFPPLQYVDPDGKTSIAPQKWEILPLQQQPLKNLGSHEVRAILNRVMWMPTQSAEERAREALQIIKKRGRYWPQVM